MGKSKDKSKHKKHRKTSDSDEDVDAKRHKTEKLAAKLAVHLQKGNATGFVWNKKIEKDLGEGKSVKEVLTRKNEEERLEEIEKVRKRQADREAEKARKEEELLLLQRIRAAQEAFEGEEKEQEFYLKGLITRAARRLEEQRPAIVDLLAKNLHLTDRFEPDLKEPWRYMEGLLLEDMTSLLEDMHEYEEYDKYEELHVQYWKALAVIGQYELAEARRRDEADRAVLRGYNTMDAGGAGSAAQAPERGLQPSVEAEIQAMLQGQRYGQLQQIEAEVEQSLRSGQGDPEYWDAILKRLQVSKAKAQIRDILAQLMQRYIARITAARAEAEAAGVAAVLAGQAVGGGDGAAASGAEPSGTGAVAGPSGARDGGVGAGVASGTESDGGEQTGSGDDAEAPEPDDGRYSPPPLDIALVAGQEVIHEDDLYREIELLRQQVQLLDTDSFKAAVRIAGRHGRGTETREERPGMVSHPMMRHLTDAAPNADEPGASFRSGRVGAAAPGEEEKALAEFRTQANRVMGVDEGDRDFTGEVPLDARVYWWHQKYKPRRPKYFNRVHTGYEWNKYNQTHYDSDNPPPKVVQGYKFNILYHDLIDKSKTPTYSIEKDPSSTDGTTLLLRFTAGPPYEDIAFRVVNKEWEYSHKRGFKCTFERGILHLFFNFNRARYRR